MKKKILLSVITFCLAVSLVACGEETDEPKHKSKSKTTKQETEISSESGAIEAKPEIINAGWDSGLFQINDTLVQLPLHLSDWIALGFDYRILGGIGEDRSKDFLFGPNESISIALIVNNEELCHCFNLENTSDEYKTAEECDPIIKTIVITENSFPVNEFFFPGNLTFGQSFRDIEQTYGKPKEITEEGYSDVEMVYHYGSLGEVRYLQYGLNVSASKDTQKIKSFRIGKNIDSCKFEEFAPIEILVDGTNVSFLWLPTYINTDNGKEIKSVLEYNDQTYLITMCADVFAPKIHTYAGNSFFDETDENGVRRYVSQNRDASYQIVYLSDTWYYSGMLNIQNLTGISEDAQAETLNLEELAIEIAKSVQIP